MREIKLNDVEYLRGIVKRATVDESSLKFINGVALVEATVVSERFGGDNTFNCFGLIDENFQEVYNDKSPSVGGRNLMFLPYNIKAERFSDNDFVVEVPCSDGENASWVEHRHIRVVDGLPTVINKIGGWPVRTRKEGLVIAETFRNLVDGWILYDINEGKFVTPQLVSIRETEENGGLFDVTLKVALEKSKSRYELIDYLFFRIDSSGKIISSILSTLENGYLDIASEGSIEELITNRKQYLQDREVQFREELSEFRKCIDTTTKGSAGYVMKMQPIDENNQ